MHNLHTFPVFSALWAVQVFLGLVKTYTMHHREFMSLLGIFSMQTEAV